MGTLIDGKAIAEKIQEHTAKKIADLKKMGGSAKLAVVLVGDDKPSETYVRKKGELAQSLGLDFALYKFPTTSTAPELKKELLKIQSDSKLTGLIIQLPLPEHMYTQEILNAINPAIDVDCLTDTNLGRLVTKTQKILPPTPGAVLSILEDLHIPLSGKNVTIIGMGALVGKPLAIMVVNEGASVTTINSRTKDTKQKCLSADIIISGVGKKDLVRGDMVASGAIVIDTGVAFDNGKMFGDVNVPEALQKASFVTPTPGGVGPITVARLLLNTVLCAIDLQKNRIRH